MSTATGIRCGNCHHYHESVAEVRMCHQGRVAAPATVERTSPLPTAGPLATARQVNFLRKLCEERNTTLEHETDVKALTMSGASQLITELLAQPKANKTIAAPALTAPKVPAGRYALMMSEDGTNDGDVVVRFFRVDCPTEGPWAGRTFVKVQAGDEFYRVKGETAQTVLRLIAKDPKKAMLLYGTELGHCGHCGRTLTNEESREYGIGPICRAKMGW